MSSGVTTNQSSVANEVNEIPTVHYDYYTQEVLDEELYQVGRNEEMNQMERHGVKEEIDIADATGGKHIRGKIIAHYKKNKDGSVIVRWRLVGMEINQYQRDDCFAGTPALKVFRMLVSKAASSPNSKGIHRRAIGFYDACVAFFHAELENYQYCSIGGVHGGALHSTLGVVVGGAS